MSGCHRPSHRDGTGLSDLPSASRGGRSRAGTHTREPTPALLSITVRACDVCAPRPLPGPQLTPTSTHC